jgi:hypothetical protein
MLNLPFVKNGQMLSKDFVDHHFEGGGHCNILIYIGSNRCISFILSKSAS